MTDTAKRYQASYEASQGGFREILNPAAGLFNFAGANLSDISDISELLDGSAADYIRQAGRGASGIGFTADVVFRKFEGME